MRKFIPIAVAVSLVSLPGFVAVRRQAPQPRPQFEVASIKSDSLGCVNGSGGPPSPGRLRVPLHVGPVIPILDAPGWVDSDLFEITAKAADNASIKRMYGPMLQMLVEDKFRLKIHGATRQLPVYGLIVAKSGLKLSPTNPVGRNVVDNTGLAGQFDMHLEFAPAPASGGTADGVEPQAEGPSVLPPSRSNLD